MANAAFWQQKNEDNSWKNVRKKHVNEKSHRIWKFKQTGRYVLIKIIFVLKQWIRFLWLPLFRHSLQLIFVVQFFFVIFVFVFFFSHVGLVFDRRLLHAHLCRLANMSQPLSGIYQRIVWKHVRKRTWPFRSACVLYFTVSAQNLALFVQHRIEIMIKLS